MPELPEVETIVRQLIKSGQVLNKPIVKIEFFRPNRWINITPQEVNDRLIGRSFQNVIRRGKYIILLLNDGSKIIIHLRMTGKLLWKSALQNDEKHVREVFHFEDGTSLHFKDSRTLGRLYFLKPSQTGAPLDKLGIEPLSSDFTEKKFQNLLMSCNLEIKDFLLNQAKVVGIGNIYAVEILFQCNIHPQRRTKDINPSEITCLANTIPEILNKAIANEGTTILNYRTAENRTGQFQQQLKVYGKTGQPCKKCTAPIVRIVQKQRSSFFCPNCQKL